MFSRIFNVFSRRDEVAETSNLKPLSREFRNRVIMLLEDTLRSSYEYFLNELQRKVSYLKGRTQLTKSNDYRFPNEDLLYFMYTCKDEEFLDIIELIFCSGIQGITYPDNPLINGINEFFNIDNLPYYLTGYIEEEFEIISYGNPSKGIRIKEFPRVIRKDCEILHKNVLEPTLELLKNEEFKYANNEFLSALEDFRKNDLRDCLTKCGSSFESVMKVLCDKNTISFKNTDTTSVLLKTLFANSNLEGYWKENLIFIATLRNKLSSSHGAGTRSKELPEHIAAYMINVTASAILFLYDEFY